MSTTRSLHVALTYLGIKKTVPTVLGFDISTVVNGADISEFSQFPAEYETVFNAGAFLEYERGMDTIHVTEYGVVRQLLVKLSCNTQQQVDSSRGQDPLAYSAVLRVLI
jgi:hypothetical protein